MNDIEKAVERIRLLESWAKSEDNEPFTGDPDKCSQASTNSLEYGPDGQPNDVSQQNTAGIVRPVHGRISSGESTPIYDNTNRESCAIRQIEAVNTSAIPNSATLVELPLEQMRKNGYLVPDSAKGLLTEEYRRVKRPLLKNISSNSMTKNSNVIMVTSSISGEGKTYTALNLAMSIALERDRTVLLVDGDVIKGSASGVLGIDRRAKGLTDLLAGDCSDMQQVILATNVPGFNFLPSGSNHDYANELLSSSAMSQCMDELAERYSDRVIVIDSSPMLQTNEAGIMAEHAGQIVFVVAWAETSQKMITEAIQQIDKDTYVGILLNKSNTSGRGYGYGYSYE